ncbi:Probable RNA-directed DNA polymerase from transposon BS [Eumeta japonica]|uniref:Probable RNA-directed DNA polymerase from transposon BS n=1 Tax=Eumeta variegata TaxID=151549 RepID=A0A4C1TG16_EUMVA|nr:Probable RNA-directed DNA polymerase from transposon BS [Eumeta japonica]
MLVKSLKIKKAPGLDGISNEVSKCFSLPLLSLLVAIFNACLRNCYFSPVCKEAEVIGIHKPRKPRDLPNSYRPIGLLSGLSKLFERILKTRLRDHLLGKGLIIDEQFGFHPVHLCPQQILRQVEYISEGFKSKRKTVVVFFDVAKTFDRVALFKEINVKEGESRAKRYFEKTSTITHLRTITLIRQVAYHSSGLGQEVQTHKGRDQLPKDNITAIMSRAR